MNFHPMRLVRILALASLLGLPMLGMCARNMIPANLHSVNYSEEEFEYWLEDPTDPKNRGGGESVEPFAASGTMCCYALPKEWHPGLKVTIHATYSFKKSPDAELEEKPQVQTVDIPPYVDGKVGEIWVVRAANGDLSAISSDYQPDHPKWPGVIKGWPVPSLTYKRKQWDRLIKLAQENVELYLRLSTKMKENPDANAKDAWASQKMIRPKTLADFTGADDPKFRAYLVDDYQQDLISSQKKLQHLIDSRP